MKGGQSVLPYARKGWQVFSRGGVHWCVQHMAWIHRHGLPMFGIQHHGHLRNSLLWKTFLNGDARNEVHENSAWISFMTIGQRSVAVHLGFPALSDLARAHTNHGPHFEFDIHRCSEFVLLVLHASPVLRPIITRDPGALFRVVLALVSRGQALCVVRDRCGRASIFGFSTTLQVRRTYAMSISRPMLPLECSTQAFCFGSPGWR